MLRNILTLVIVLGIVGLVVGYFIFGHQTGPLGDTEATYIPIGQLLGVARQGFLNNVVGGFSDAVNNVKQVRANIVYSGLAGALVGLVVGIFYRPRRRRRR